MVRHSIKGLSSRPAVLPRQPLTEPYVTLSRHTALVIPILSKKKIHQCANRVGRHCLICFNHVNAYVRLERFCGYLHFVHLYNRNSIASRMSCNADG